MRVEATQMLVSVHCLQQTPSLLCARPRVGLAAAFTACDNLPLHQGKLSVFFLVLADGATPRWMPQGSQRIILNKLRHVTAWQPSAPLTKRVTKRSGRLCVAQWKHVGGQGAAPGKRQRRRPVTNAWDICEFMRRRGIASSGIGSFLGVTQASKNSGRSGSTLIRAKTSVAQRTAGKEFCA